MILKDINKNIEVEFDDSSSQSGSLSIVIYESSREIIEEKKEKLKQCSSIQLYDSVKEYPFGEYKNIKYCSCSEYYDNKVEFIFYLDTDEEITDLMNKINELENSQKSQNDIISEIEKNVEGQ